jgi:hypothetical protein
MVANKTYIFHASNNILLVERLDDVKTRFCYQSAVIPMTIMPMTFSPTTDIPVSFTPETMFPLHHYKQLQWGQACGEGNLAVSNGRLQFSKHLNSLVPPPNHTPDLLRGWVTRLEMGRSERVGASENLLIVKKRLTALATQIYPDWELSIPSTLQGARRRRGASIAVASIVVVKLAGVLIEVPTLPTEARWWWSSTVW